MYLSLVLANQPPGWWSFCCCSPGSSPTAAALSPSPTGAITTLRQFFVLTVDLLALQIKYSPVSVCLPPAKKPKVVGVVAEQVDSVEEVVDEPAGQVLSVLSL